MIPDERIDELIAWSGSNTHGGYYADVKAALEELKRLRSVLSDPVTIDALDELADCFEGQHVRTALSRATGSRGLPGDEGGG